MISSATIANGKITISGTNFGQRATSATLVYEDFDSRTTGALATDFGYHNYDGFGGTTSVDQTNSYSGNKSLKHQAHMAAVSNDVQESFPHIGVRGFSSIELFISYKIKFNTNGSRISQLKFNRSGMEVGDNWPCYNGFPKFRSSYYPGSKTDKTLRFLQGGVVRADNSIDEGWIGETAGYTGTPFAIPENTWVQVEEYYRLNDIGQNNGEFVTSVNGNQHFNFHNLKLRDNNAQVLNCSYLVTGVDYFIEPTSTDGVSIWYDDHYLANTRARIVLANSSNWSAATIRNPLAVTSWNDANVSAHLQTAGFAANTTAWIYIVNANGQISQGWPVTIPATTSSASSTSSIASSSSSSKSSSSLSSSSKSSKSSSSSTSSTSTSSSVSTNNSFPVRVQGLRIGGQLTLNHGVSNTVVTLNDPINIPTTKAVGTALDLRITAQPEGQTCALSELAPTTIPDVDSPIFVRCVHNEVAHPTLPDTFPNDELNVNYNIRDTAYPGIPYESRPGVIGGIFPYEYRLTGLTLDGVTQSIANVSLDFRRGTLRFTPAREGTYVVSMQIKDSGASQKTLIKNFTIQVSATRFLFVSPSGVDATGRGSIVAPYRNLAFALTQSTPNHVIVMRKGNYSVEKSDLGDTKSKQIVAYPDEVVLVDFAKQNSFWIKNGDSSAPVARLEGLDIANISQYGITCDPCRSALIIRNIRFISGYETGPQSENPSFVHGRDWGLRQNRMLIQDNDFGKYTMTFINNNFAAMVLFSAGDSIVENNQMRQNQTSSIGKGIVDKGWPDHNTHRENYIELAANQPEHDGIFLMAQAGSHNVHMHHNLLINAGIVLGGQCFQTTCPFVDNTAHHNTLVNGGVVLSWGPLNPPSSGTRVSHNLIKSSSKAPYYGLSCMARPNTADIISKLNFGSNMIESSNSLALKDSECSGNDLPWAEWQGTYGLDKAASGTTVAPTSALVESGILSGLPPGDLRKTQRGHQY